MRLLHMTTPSLTTPPLTTPLLINLMVHAIDVGELDEVRRTGMDRAGHRVEELLDSEGGAQLRCCLTRSRTGDNLLLMSHAPLRHERPWREFGPVYVHAEACTGHDPAAGVPAWLDDGARVLRAYRSDGSMQHAAHRIVGPGDGVARALTEMLGEPGVVEVHVRNLREQCFILRVTAP